MTIADLDSPPPAVARGVEPGVERRLRLLEQRDVLEAGLPRRLARVSSRATASNDAGTVRRTSCSVERVAGVVVPDAGVPRGREMPEVAADASTGDRLRHLVGAPHGRIGAVRFAPPYESHDLAEATSRIGFSAPRRRASSPITCARRSVPRKRGAAGGKILVSRQVQERGQQRSPLHLTGVDGLWNLLHPDLSGVFDRGRIRPRQRAIGRAEIDADDETLVQGRIRDL